MKADWKCKARAIPQRHKDPVNRLFCSEGPLRSKTSMIEYRDMSASTHALRTGTILYWKRNHGGRSQTSSTENASLKEQASLFTDKVMDSFGWHDGLGRRAGSLTKKMRFRMPSHANDACHQFPVGLQLAPFRHIPISLARGLSWTGTENRPNLPRGNKVFCDWRYEVVETALAAGCHYLSYALH